jgi:protein tyrosine phosphatase (PTP) superfamily phosphohydrolase (DUF442 family)
LRRATALVLAVGLARLALAVPNDPPERIEAPSIENLYRLAPGLYSGGQPEGEAGFSTLRRLGIRTIISVDGPRPDVESARRQGIRYVHLPVGYDEITPEQAARLVKAAGESPGPVFIHCHHGLHRGPAAAALCGMALHGWSKAHARAWLERAGTSPDYTGLFATVDRFTPPSDAELAAIDPAELPEAAEVPALVEAMGHIDATWDHLKAIERAGFCTPPQHPDLDPHREAVTLAEAFHELQRLDEVRAKGDEFARLLDETRRAAADLAASLKPPDQSPPASFSAPKAFARVAASCVSCHRRFRDH